MGVRVDAVPPHNFLHLTNILSRSHYIVVLALRAFRASRTQGLLLQPAASGLIGAFAQLRRHLGQHLALMRLGVATTQRVIVSDRRSVLGSCGLVKWCHDVASFVALPFFAGNASALVLRYGLGCIGTLCPHPISCLLTNTFEPRATSNNASYVLALCGTELPWLRVVRFDAELELLVSLWARRTSRALTESNFSASSWTKQLSCGSSVLDRSNRARLAHACLPHTHMHVHACSRGPVQVAALQAYRV